MTNFERLASERRSIRKYQDKDVNIDDVVECVKIATTAPSGCNSQCWKFVLIHNRETINEMASIVIRKQEGLLGELELKDDPVYLESRVKGLTFFRHAPVCVAVFMTKMDYYDKKMERSLAEHGYTYDETMSLFGYPDLLSIGAAIENLLLALTERGYGACWMNDPIIAHRELSEYLGMKPDERLISLIPVGHSAYAPRGKKYKDLSEVLRIIE
jgi:nitroreductase